MANIIFVTNMEPHYVGMRDALNTMENKEISDAVEVIHSNFAHGKHPVCLDKSA